MQISADEHKLIIAGLRVASIVYKDKGKLARDQGRRREYAECDNFADECAKLAERLDREGRRGAGSLIIPGR